MNKNWNAIYYLLSYVACGSLRGAVSRHLTNVRRHSRPSACGHENTPRIFAALHTVTRVPVGVNQSVGPHSAPGIRTETKRNFRQPKYSVRKRHPPDGFIEGSVLPPSSWSPFCFASALLLSFLKPFCRSQRPAANGDGGHCAPVNW